MKIEPKRVIDVGVGFGRWGMIVREFCDVWYDRVLVNDWQVHIEGIEGFAANITDYHKQFYNQIHIGDARQVLPELLKSNWDVIIFGDVLEHFSKEEGTALLGVSLAVSDYVLVNIPLGDDWPQEDKYNNPYERHLSVWTAAEFEDFHLKRAAFFQDFSDRPFGSFVLSKTDPQRLALRLFSKSTSLSRLNQIDGYQTPVQHQLLAQAEQTAQELDQIKNTLTWKTYEAVDHSFLGKPLRYFMKIAGAPIRRQLAKKKAYQKTTQTTLIKSVQINNSQQLVRPIKLIKSVEFSDEEQAWLDQINEFKSEAIAIVHPHWRGVRSATVNLFPACRFVDDNVDGDTAQHLAHLLAETTCRRFIFSGFAITHQHLVTALHQTIPEAKIYAFWLGSFLQSSESYAWQTFRLVQDLCQAGLIYKWGFAKKGMAEIIAKTGLRTGFIMSYVKDIPAAPSVPLGGGPHLGVWIPTSTTWRKPPYAMLAASLMIPDACVHGSGANERVREFARVMQVNAQLQDYSIPQENMPAVLSQMHLNLYVTLSECAPMLPLESLSVGTPCLFGPNSHLFEDHEYLHQTLVVPYPDSAFTIAKYTQQALEQRNEIIKSYINYAPDYNERARASLKEFLEIDVQHE